MERSDIQALKHADAVTFHQFEDGTGEIRATARRMGDVWSARNQRLFPDTSYRDERMRTINVKTQVSAHGVTPVNPTAFHMIHYAAGDRSFQTVVSMLREGDKLTLKWVAGNDNQNTRNLGWHRDELYLQVYRAGKKPRELMFLIAVEVGPDNTARMVKP